MSSLPSRSFYLICALLTLLLGACTPPAPVENTQSAAAPAGSDSAASAAGGQELNV
jgi:hypothetical protein